MFIGCETQSHYPDYYWIEEVETLDELQEYIKNKIPVKGQKVKHKYHSSVVLDNDTYTTLIYLNNYLNIRKSTLYFMKEEDFNKMFNEQCKVCKNYDNLLGCAKRFEPDTDKVCGNYIEPKNELKKKWLRFWC